MGMGRWPFYEQPAALVFSDAEKAALAKFAVDNPELSAKIREYSAVNAAIVAAHNKKALEVNLKQLKDGLGYEERELKEIEARWRRQYRIQE